MEMIVKVKGTTALNLNFSKSFFVLIVGSFLMLILTHKFIANTPGYHSNTAVSTNVHIEENYIQTNGYSSEELLNNNETGCDRSRFNPLGSLGSDVVENQLVVDCSTVWIKGSSLEYKDKIKMLNTIVSLETERASWLESFRDPLTISGLVDHFNDKTRQPGGFITDYNRFKNIERNEYITTIYLLPGNVLPIEDMHYYNKNDFDSNYLVKDYFPCTITGEPGKWVKRTANHYNSTCEPGLDALAQPKPHMDPRFYSYHGWSNLHKIRHQGYGISTSFSKDWNMNCDFCKQHPNFLTYVNIIRNAVIMDPTVIFQVDLKMKILNLQCQLASYRLPTEYSVRAALKGHYHFSRDVVFSISNHWQGNEGYWMLYHVLGEGLTKLSLYVDFLRANPNVAIHIKDKKPAMKLKNIFYEYWNLQNEVIFGSVFARVLILPEGNPCFQPGYLYLQSTHQLLGENLNLDGIKPDSILYIQRTSSRELLEEESIINFLTLLTTHYKLKLNIFSDKNVPSFQDLAAMFRSSYLTIGAHGAGLTNVLFSTKRTAVFEIICEVSPATFAHMSHKLGLRHHAFFGHRVGPNRCDEGITIQDRMADFKYEVEQLLRMVMLDPTFKKFKLKGTV